MTFVHSEPPKDLVDKLVSFPRVAAMVEMDWGSVRLDKFLLELVSDSFKDDGRKRQGFPLDVFDAITKLQLFNLAVLKDKGIITDEDEEDPNSRFGLSPWEIPKNF